MGVGNYLVGGYLVGSMIGDRRADKQRAEWEARLYHEEQDYRRQQEAVAQQTLQSQLRQERMIWEGTPEGQAYKRWRPEAEKALQIVAAAQREWHNAWYRHYLADREATARRNKRKGKITLSVLVGVPVSLAMLPILLHSGITMVVNILQLLGLLVGNGYNPTPLFKGLDDHVPSVVVLLASCLAFCVPAFIMWMWYGMTMDWKDRMHRDAYARTTATGDPIDPSDTHPAWPSWDADFTTSYSSAWLMGQLRGAVYAFPTYNGKLPRTRFRVVEPKDEFPDEVNEVLRQVRKEVGAAGLRPY